MKKGHLAISFAIVAVLTVVLLAVLRSPGNEGDSFRAMSDLDASETQEPPAPKPAPSKPALPDPRLGQEKQWEEPISEGPVPEGFGSHFVQHEKALHAVFRRQLGDEIELCLDEMRRRGESFEGRLVFHVSALPARDLKMAFRLNGIRAEASEPSGPDAEANPQEELPSDVYQCIWDTVEAVEMTLPLMAISIFPREGQPDLFVPYEVREQSPAGPVEIEVPVDAGVLDIGNNAP